MSGAQLTQAFEALVADVHEVDLAQRAWREASERRSQRRRRTAAAAALLVIAAGTIWVGSGRSHDLGLVQVPAQSVAPSLPIRIPTLPAPTATSPARQPAPWIDPQGWRVDSAGVRRIRLLDVTRYGELPMFNGPLGALGGTVTDLSQLPAEDSVAPATAVSLQGDRANDPSSTYSPVVLTGGRLIRLDDVTLRPLGAWLPGDSRAVSPDGSGLVFPQPSRVVVADLVTRTVHRIVVPDQGLEAAGWSSSDPGVVIARSAERTWRVDLRTRTVRPAAPQDHDSVFEVREAPNGDELLLDRLGPAGVTTMQLGSGLGSPTFRSVSAHGRTAIATRGDAGQHSIVVADTTRTGAGGRPALSVLTIDFGLGLPIGWDPTGRYLHFEAGAGGGTYVLVWDVETGGVYRAARMNSTGGTAIPIALGAGYQQQ